MIKLVVQSGPARGQVFLPPPGVDVEIGRGEECFVRIEDSKVSRRHAVLKPAGASHAIHDLGSSNGTFVNEQRIREARLKSGDLVRVGDTDLAYVLAEKDPWIGKVLAGYRVEELIGRGGMGRVYLAHQLGMDRAVALKILAPELGKDAEFVARFVAEARAMAKVSHPHVVQVHNVGQHEGAYFLSMEHLGGGSLRQLLDTEGAISARRAVALALDAADALVWAEQQGIVHRDIKPGNLMLDENGRVKVADFGLAADLTQSTVAREEGHVRGSPHFMAPEQAQGKLPDHRSDIYALGTTLYVMLTGKNPFPGRSLREVLAVKLREDPVPPSRLVPGIPPRLDAVLARAMARRPEDRHQHAQELWEDLGRVLRELGPPGLPDDTRGDLTPADGPVAARRGKPAPRTLAVVGAAALAAVIALGAWLASPGGAGRPAPGPEEVPSEVAAAPGAPREVPPRVASTPPAPEPAGKPPAEPDPVLPPPPETAEPPPAAPEPGARVGEAELPRGVPALILESRFDEAIRALEEHRRRHPEDGTRVEAEMAGVRAAERLFEVRARALDLEAAGDLDAAAALLREVLDGLPEPYLSEARRAVESIEARK